jgi:outer membrane protein TolC
MQIDADASDTSELPPEFATVHSEIIDVIAFLSPTNKSRGRLQEADAQLQGSKQKWLPTISFDTALSRQKSESQQNGMSSTVLGPLNSLQLGLTLKQNLYAGGSDLAHLQTDERKLSLAALQENLSERETIKNWMMDLIQLQHLVVLSQFNAQAIEQASQLHRQTQRKVASGFLGKRDLLNSQRELLRVQHEALSNNNQLTDRVQRHRSTFGTKEPQIAAEKIVMIFEKEERFRKADTRDDTDENVIERSLIWRTVKLESDIAAKDVDLSLSNRFSPRIDAVAGWNKDVQDNLSLTATSHSARRQNWNVALNGSIAVQPPLSFAAVEAARARLLTSKISEQKQRKDLLTTLAAAFENVNGNEKEFQLSSQLTEATRRLHEQNLRLFEAGEISLDRLIATQQDLDRDQKTMASLKHQGQQYRLTLFFAKNWQLPPAQISTADQP